MSARKTIYILGAGAVGFPLAAFLADAGRPVVAVRTSRTDVTTGVVMVTVRSGEEPLQMPVKTASLSSLSRLDGTIVITAKAHANEAIARELKAKDASGPIVILQNGLSVEKPFLDAQFSPLYRGILYVTSQAESTYAFTFRPVTASPIGVIHGDASDLEEVVASLTTSQFPFRPETNIQREVWKKAIINSVFNSLCPLLDVDNGVFMRDEGVTELAREVVRECLPVTNQLGLGLSEAELMEQVLRISRRSEGQLISTLQDIKSGRDTEIEFLNLEITRIAASLQPARHLPVTEFLGKMVVAKSHERKPGSSDSGPDG